jgi:hypothetical protein
MWFVQADMAHGVVEQVKQRDLISLLQNVHPEMHPMT